MRQMSTKYKDKHNKINENKNEKGRSRIHIYSLVYLTHLLKISAFSLILSLF